MARLAGRLERFSRDFDFVVHKPMLVNGQKWTLGQPVDKSKFTTRRLRQLYEWRHIRRVVAPVVPVELVTVKKRGRPRKIAA